MAEVYSYIVHVWTEDGSEYQSAAAFFETGITEDEEWGNVPFIALSGATETPPIFRTEQKILNMGIMSARLYITAVGVYKVYINGQAADKNVHIAPGYCDGERSIAYQIYDVTEMISENRVAVSVVTGTGWMDHNGSDIMGSTSNREGVKALLIIKYKDGTTKHIATDTKVGGITE